MNKESIFMILLIIFLIAGSALAYISNQNLMPVSVNLGPYIVNEIPLFYVIIASLLFGLVFSTVIHTFHDISAFWTLRGKKNELQKKRNEVAELTKRVHQLELENEKLKHFKGKVVVDSNAL